MGFPVQIPWHTTIIPSGFTVGPDGNLWFTDKDANKVGHTNPAVNRVITISGFDIPTSGSRPLGIVAGSDGALWFAEALGNKIGRITTSGTITEFSLPNPYSNPEKLVLGPDGNIWFTESDHVFGQRIGRIMMNGMISEYRIPQHPVVSSGTDLNGIAVAPDGIWFTSLNYVGHITTDGVTTDFPVSRVDSASGMTTFPILGKLTADRDSGVWALEQPDSLTGRAQIARISAAGDLMEFMLPDAQYPAFHTNLVDIATGLDGNIWFTHDDLMWGGVSHITTSGSVVRSINSRQGSALTVGPQGNIFAGAAGAVTLPYIACILPPPP